MCRWHLSSRTLTNGAVFQRVTVAQGGTRKLNLEKLRIADMPQWLGIYCRCRTAIYAVLNLNPIARIGRLNPNRKVNIGTLFDIATGKTCVGLNPNLHSLMLIGHSLTP